MDVYEKFLYDETCDVVVDDDMSEYERMAKEHDNRQPFIQQELIEAIYYSL